MSNVLYQKYRPQKFKDLVGQQHIKITIENQIATGKIAHAYLFCGPRAVGKTTTARLLAKAINCENRKAPESEPCNKCSACVEISNGNSMDVLEIDAASNTGVDNVRENVIASARVSPSKNKYKVFIIDEVHMLSISSFNALLKTLEEPPKNVVFILATTEIHKVPGTIISRCQRYDFKKISNKEIIECLKEIAVKEDREVEQDVLKSIAAQSDGCLRDAESLFGQVLCLDEKIITSENAELVIPRSNFNLVSEFSAYVLAGDMEKSLYFINKLAQEGIDLKFFVKDLVEFFRKIILVKIGGGLDYFSLEFDADIERNILSEAEKYDVEKIIRAIELFLEAGENLKKSDILALPLELAVLKLITSRDNCVKTVFEKRENGLNAEVGNKPVKNEIINERIESEESKTNSILSEKSVYEAIIPDNSGVEENTEAKTENQEIISGNSEINLSLNEIKRRWEDIIDMVKKTNPSICFILKVSRPAQLNKNILKIAHTYDFHLQIIQERKNKDVLEKALKEIFNCALFIESFVSDDTSGLAADSNLPLRAGADLTQMVNDKNEDIEPMRKETNLLQDILGEFGGEVVG